MTKSKMEKYRRAFASLQQAYASIYLQEQISLFRSFSRQVGRQVQLLQWYSFRIFDYSQTHEKQSTIYWPGSSSSVCKANQQKIHIEKFRSTYVSGYVRRDARTNHETVQLKLEENRKSFSISIFIDDFLTKKKTDFYH